LPDIQNVLVDEYADQGLVAVGLDPDAQDYLAPESVAAFVLNQGVYFPIAVEESGETPTYSDLASVHAGSNPYPIDVLVDKQGIIRYVAREYDPVGLEAKIQELLAE
jgi:peroxiredoxin